MFATISCSASGLPLISRPSSKPSFMSSSCWMSTTDVDRTSTASVAPSRLASSSRTGFTSVTTTYRAPACCATAHAISPIGPAPVISTSSPSTGNVRVECTALPNGSKIAATSRSIAGSWCQTLVIGSAISSANAPGRSTPTLEVFAQRCRRPARQFRHRPQTTCPSPLTSSPGWKSLTLEPTDTTSPTNSWPITSGGVTAARAHSFQSAMCTSVPPIPVRSTRINTSLMPVSGSGTCVRVSPGPGACLVRASIASVCHGPGTRAAAGRVVLQHEVRPARTSVGRLAEASNRCAETPRCASIGATKRPPKRPTKGKGARTMRSATWRICGAIIVCGLLTAACSSASSTSSPPVGGTTSSSDEAAPSSSSFSSTGSPVDGGTIDGNWNGTYQPSGGGSGTFSVTFKQTGSSLNGTLSINVSCLDGAKVAGKVNGDTIQFGSVQGQCSVDYNGKINGDQMSGSYDIGGGTGGNWKASKT